MFIDNRLKETDHQRDRQYTIGEHERQHAKITKEFWNSRAPIVDFWERKYCSEQCATIAADIATSKNLLNRYESDIENLNFDERQYGAVGYNNIRRTQISYAANRLKEDIIKRTQEFYQSGCAILP